MITPEAVEEHLQQVTTRNELTRLIQAELARELKEDGLLEQILKKRVYAETIKRINQEESNKDEEQHNI